MSKIKNKTLNVPVRSVGSKNPHQILKIKVPESLIDKLNNYKLEIVDYNSVANNTQMIFLMDKKGDIDISSFKLNMNDSETFKRVFENINSYLSEDREIYELSQTSGQEDLCQSKIVKS